jgi:hypothetical protein
VMLTPAGKPLVSHPLLAEERPPLNPR